MRNLRHIGSNDRQFTFADARKRLRAKIFCRYHAQTGGERPAVSTICSYARKLEQKAVEKGYEEAMNASNAPTKRNR